MSLLDIGKRCFQCATVDFLPTTCPSCQQIFCGAHIQSHDGCRDSSTSASYPIARPSTFVPKAKCEVGGCGRASIEAVGGREGDGPVDIAKQVRCGVCGGSFRVLHRQQAKHSCPGPLDYTHRSEAAAARKAAAQSILAKHFPESVGKVIPKPPSGRDVPLKHHRPPSPTRLPPSLQPTPVSVAEERVEDTKKVKTKSEKLHELHIRKIRSLAVPLDNKQKADDRPRRFFEIGQGEVRKEDVEVWRTSGKWGKADKVWVLADIPLGKVYDLLLERGRIPRPRDQNDPSQIPSLISLSAPPDQPREVSPLNLATLSSSIADGSLLVIVRGWSAS